MAELISLDPTSELASNAQFDIEGGANGIRTVEIEWDDPDPDIIFAGTADTEGDLLISSRPSNRQVQGTVKVTAATAAALDIACGQLQQKIGKIASEFGTLKRTTSGGNVGVLDLLYARCAPKGDWDYVNALTALIPVRFTALPYWRGPEVGSFLDDFSSDKLAANYTAYTPGNWSVAGGVLAPLGVNPGSFIYNAGAVTQFSDAQITYKVTTGAAISQNLRLRLRQVDASNYLYLQHAGTTLSMVKRVAGVAVGLPANASVAHTMLANTSYWLRFRAEGNKITAEVWTSAPTPTGTPAASVTHTLAGSDATTFGQGVAGSAVWEINTIATDYRFDEFALDPYVYIETTNPVLVTPPIYGIKGDVPALARFALNDMASQDQWWLVEGSESRYFSQGLPTVLDQFGTDTIGSGAWAFDLGSGTIAVSGGQLVPSTAADKWLFRTDASYTDNAATIKFTTGASVAGFVAVFLKRLSPGSNSNSVFGQINCASGALTIEKFDSTVGSVLATTAGAALAVSTSYWLRVKIVGNDLTAELFTADPATGAAATRTVIHTLAVANAAKFGSGVAGQSGIRFLPAAVDWRGDDFRIQPLAGCTEALIDNESLLTSGYSGVQATRAGAFSGGTVANSVVRHTMTSGDYVTSCATPPLGHVGNYHVFARIIRANPGTPMSIAFEWATGDFQRVTRNDEVSFIGGDREGDFLIVDLGTIQIPKVTKGVQQWMGRVIAKSPSFGVSYDLDYLFLVPYAEGSAEVVADFPSATPPVFVVRDEFTSLAGGTALNGLAPQVGPGTWATSGAVTDFTAGSDAPSVGDHTMQRASITSDSGTVGRIAAAGTAVLTDTDVSVLIYRTADVNLLSQSAVARYVDIQNFLSANFSLNSTATAASLSLVRWVANTATTLKTIVINKPPINSWNRIRLVVDVNGRYLVQLYNAAGTILAEIEGNDAVLATGGALASGKVGFLDKNLQTATAVTRYYDTLGAAAPVADAVMYAGKAVELRWDGCIRQDPAGVSWPKRTVQGDFARLKPAGRENRQNRIVIDTCRNDPQYMFDPSLSKTQLQVIHTPRYLSLAAG